MFRLDSHLELLKANFTIVGDNGEGESPTQEELIKQSDNSYVLWLSGRQGCNSMIIQMKVDHNQVSSVIKCYILILCIASKTSRSSLFVNECSSAKS